MTGEPTAAARRRPSEMVIAFVTWFVGALIFFRASFESGFDKIAGNVGDARLIAVLHEHWLDVIRGQAAWRSPNFFYPQRGALGYSDTFALNEVFYLPLRAAGFDMYAAFQWTLILLSLVGFASVFQLGRRWLHLPLAVSALLAWAFCFANSLYLKAGHPQLYSVYWLPFVLLLAVTSCNVATRRAAGLLAVAAGMMLGLVTYSTYYIGWFALLATGMLVVVFVLLRLFAEGWRAVLGLAKQALPRLAAGAVGFAFAMIPFVATYLPVLKKNGGHDYATAMSYAPRPGDLVNVGGNNYVWGGLLHKIFGGSSPRLANSEVSLALTPLLALSVVALTLAAVLVGWRRGGRDRSTDLALALGIVAVCLVVLPVRFGLGSLWTIPWHAVPGAVAIRAIGRVQIVSVLVAVLAVAVSLRVVAYRKDAAKRLPARSLAIALLALIAVEQINTDRNSIVDRSDELQLIIDAPDAPGSCQAFFITDSGPAVPSFQSNIDAMIIAQSKGLPTLNGYSGQLPQGWNLDPSNPGYLDQVRSWMALEQMSTQGICSYDRATHRWSETPLG